MAKKPKPAPIYEKRFNRYRLHFSYNGKQYRRFYIFNQHDAYVLQAEINHRLTMFKSGIKVPSAGISLADFIFENIQEKREIAMESVVTLFQLTDQYEKSLVPPKKALSTCKAEKIHLRHLRRFSKQKNLGDPHLEDLKVSFFEKYKNFRYAEGVKTDTVNKELATFRLLLQHGVDNEYITNNVVKKVKRDKSQVPSDRFRTHSKVLTMIQSGNYSEKELKNIRRFQYLSIEEIEELLALAKGKWIYAILVFFAYTGARRGEGIMLEWSDVDLSKRCLYIKSKKQSQNRSETARQIPIHNRLLPILQEQQEKMGNSRWVFVNSQGNQINVHTMRDAFERVVKNTTYEGLGFHVFRHSLASNLAAKGVEQHYIDAILGHQTEMIRKRYKHLFPHHVEAAIERIQFL